MNDKFLHWAHYGPIWHAFEDGKSLCGKYTLEAIVGELKQQLRPLGPVCLGCHRNIVRSVAEAARNCAEWVLDEERETSRSIREDARHILRELAEGRKPKP